MSTENKKARFILTWPKDLHKIAHLSARLRNENLNQWVMRCVIEQLEREKTYTIFKINNDDK